ncbi:MAG: hypothetical protein L6Q92_00850 [Phycisphaerae bacterium]|nr:hypothetical protein [Phycisphaerae bacterium]
MLSLSFRVAGATLQTINLSGGQQFVVPNITPCDCFTLENFTPPGGPETEGFGVEVCNDAQATFADSAAGFGAMTTSLSGGGTSTELVVYTLENMSTKTLNIFVFRNAAVSPSFTMAAGAMQTVTVPKCNRLRVLARDPNNIFADVNFVESPATAGAIYEYRDSGGTQIEVVKLP